MSFSKSIPLHPEPSSESSPADGLKYNVPLHPVQTIERHFASNSLATRRKLQAAAFGSALPMRLSMQQHMLSQCQRLPGLPSSYAGLDSFTGNDEKLDLDDIYNLPEHNPEMPEPPRDQLERILRIPARSEKDRS